MPFTVDGVPYEYCVVCRRNFPRETLEEIPDGPWAQYQCRTRDRKLGKCSTISPDVYEDPLKVIDQIAGTIPMTALTRYQRLDLRAAIDELKKKAHIVVRAEGVLVNLVEVFRDGPARPRGAARADAERRADELKGRPGSPSTVKVYEVRNDTGEATEL